MNIEWDAVFFIGIGIAFAVWCWLVDREDDDENDREQR